jgi:molybdenum cofactor cytidylyltransferase
MKPDAILLAAGCSRRMGTQKLLLPLHDKPVIVHPVDALLRSDIARQIVVVLGPNPRSIREALDGRPVRFVEAGATVDMLESIRAGIRALPTSCDGILVALGDQPNLSVRLLRRMAEALADAPQGIVVPICQGRRGHPLLFSADFRGEILTSFDGVGLRGLLCAHPDKIVAVRTSSSSVLEDMDTPQDYERHVRSRR